MERLAAFKDALRANGEKITSPRILMYKALTQKSPIPTTKLIALLEQNGINRTTTYRNLAVLRKLGVIQDIIAQGQRMVELGEDFGTHHHHFWCTRCGKLSDFDNPELDLAIDQLSKKLNVQVRSHQLEMLGLCADCIVRTKSTSASIATDR